MPTYDFKCHNCCQVFEAVAPMHDPIRNCPNCNGYAERQFSPNPNISIPQRFRLDRNWNNAPGSTGEPWSRNNTVHAPHRTSFKEEFNKAWDKAGGA